MDTLIIVIISIFIWIVLGVWAADVLIGDCSTAYPSTCFGPFNVYDKMEDKTEAVKINLRRTILLEIGGAISILFTLIYKIFDIIRKGIKHLLWIFS